MKGAQLAKTVKRTQSTLHLIYKITIFINNRHLTTSSKRWVYS